MDNSPNMHNTGFFPVCDGSIWILYLARYSKIFKKPNFQVVKWKSTFIWKMLSQAESKRNYYIISLRVIIKAIIISETERSRGTQEFYNVWFASQPSFMPRILEIEIPVSSQSQTVNQVKIFWRVNYCFRSKKRSLKYWKSGDKTYMFQI